MELYYAYARLPVLNDKDTDAMVRWLKQNHPENANREYAEANASGNESWLIGKSAGVTQINLKDFYREYSPKVDRSKRQNV